MLSPSSPAPQDPAQASPRPVPSAPARPSAQGPQLPIPYGVAKVIVRLLVKSQGNVEEAATIAEHWYGGADDPRFILVAEFLHDCAADPLIAQNARVHGLPSSTSPRTTPGRTTTTRRAAPKKVAGDVRRAKKVKAAR